MPGGEPWYALIGAFSLVVLPTYLPGGETAHDLLTLLFGLVHRRVEPSARPSPQSSGPPHGIPRSPRWSAVSLTWSAALTPGGHASVTSRATLRPVPDRLPVGHEQSGAGGLEVKHLKVRFGGHVAVNDVSLEAPMGRITGLIGPNGAGKTTTFNACSGLAEAHRGPDPPQGRGHLDVGRRQPGPAKASGRTFQRMQLFDSMTVAENVSLGREAELAGGNFLRQMLSKPGDRAELNRVTTDAMRLCGICHLADVQAGLLSSGQRRLVELARALAGFVRRTASR